MTLRLKTFSAVRWTTTATVSHALLQITQVAVMARILDPTDYGLMAMVSVVLKFATLFSDLGLNSAYVQRQNITPQERSSLFWINIWASLILCLLVIAASPLLAKFFGDVRLTPLLMLSASTFVLTALGQQVRMGAEKALNFRPVMLLEIVSAVLGFTTAVFMAIIGMGVYALIYGAIVTAMSSSLLAWIILADGWRPQLRCKLADIKPYIGFGSTVVGNNIANQINLSIDLLLGGHVLGTTQLGLYSIPRNLILQVQFMVNPIVTRVGFPLIAQVQHDTQRVRSIYLKTLNMTASTNAPLYIGLAFFAPETVSVLLGGKWGGAVELLRLMAIWGFVRSTGNPVGSLLLGMGRADLSLKWNLSLLLITPPLLWIGSQEGTIGLTCALLGISIFLFLPGWRLLIWPLCQARLTEYIIATLKPAFIALLAVTPSYYMAQQIESNLYRLILGVMIATPIYFFISYFLNREWVNAIHQLINKK